MPAVVPVVAAVAGYGASAALGGGLLGALGGFVLSTAVSQIGSRALTKKPKAQAFNDQASGRATVVRSAVESHKIVYGQTKVSGPLVYVGTTDSGPAQATPPRANKMLHLVIPLAGHEVEEIGTVYLNETAVTLDPSGFATSAPYVKTSTSTQTTGYQYGISAANRTSNVVTITTPQPHGYLVGETVLIGGLLLDPSFNGMYTIASIVSPTQFTYANSGVNATPAFAEGAYCRVDRTTTTTSSASYVIVTKHLVDDQVAGFAKSGSGLHP